MSNGSWSYPVVETDVKDRAQGRCLYVYVAAALDGEVIEKDKPIVKLIDNLPEDPGRRREEIEKEVEVRRTHLRRRHEAGGPKEEAAKETAAEIERLHGPGTARARGETPSDGGGGA